MHCFLTMDTGKHEMLLYRVMYCCKALEALGLPLCIICLSITFSLVLILNAQMVTSPIRLHMHSVILKYVVVLFKFLERVAPHSLL